MKKDDIRKQWNRLSLLDLSFNQTEKLKTEKPHFVKQQEINKTDYFHIEVNHSRLIFNPESKLRAGWDFIMIIITIHNIVVSPLIFSIPASVGSLKFPEKVSLGFFASDILIRLNTGFYTHGHLTSNRSRIFWHYAKGLLIPDVVFVIPYFLFPVNFAIYHFLLPFKVYRALKLKKYFETVSILLKSQWAMKVFDYAKRLLALMMVLHWLACLWLYESYYDFTRAADTWIRSEENSGLAEIYLKGVYYVVATTSTLGYGDIFPQNMRGNLVAMGIIGIGVVVFSFNITSLINNVIDYRQKRIDFHKRIINLNVYMKKKKLPPFLKSKLRRYLDYTSKADIKSKMKESSLLALLSDPLREEIFIYTVTGMMIQQCKVFTEIYEGKTIRKLSKYMQTKIFSESDLIIEEGERSILIFFIINGRVEVSHSRTQSVFKILTRGHYFGEISFFTRLPRTATIRCLEIVEILALRREHLDYILQKSPHAAAKTKQLEVLCMYNDFTALGVKCYLCRKVGHIASNCANTKLSPDVMNISSEWVRKKSMSRVINPKTYHKSNAMRNLKNNKFIKISKIPSIDETENSAIQHMSSSEYNNLRRKVSTIRLETINEEESVRAVHADPDLPRFEMVLSSEEEDSEGGSHNRGARKYYRYSVSDCTDYSSKEHKPESNQLNVLNAWIE